jgi:hypothetical protein
VNNRGVEAQGLCALQRNAALDGYMTVGAAVSHRH